MAASFKLPTTDYRNSMQCKEAIMCMRRPVATAYDGIILLRNWPFARDRFPDFSVSIAWIQSTWERIQSAAPAPAAAASPFSNQNRISIAPPLCMMHRLAIDQYITYTYIGERIKFVRLWSHYTCTILEHENTKFFSFRIGSTEEQKKTLLVRV